MYVTGQMGAYGLAATENVPASTKKCMLQVRWGPTALQPLKMSLLAQKVYVIGQVGAYGPSATKNVPPNLH